MRQHTHIEVYEGETWHLEHRCTGLGDRPLPVASAFLRVSDPDGTASLFDLESPRDIAVKGDASDTLELLATPSLQAGRYGYQLWVSSTAGETSLQMQGRIDVGRRLPRPPAAA